MIPTHKATLYGIPVYFNMDESAIWGTNWFFDLLVPLALHTHNFVAMCFPGFGEDGFPLMLNTEYKKVYSTDESKPN